MGNKLSSNERKDDPTHTRDPELEKRSWSTSTGSALPIDVDFRATPAEVFVYFVVDTITNERTHSPEYEKDEIEHVAFIDRDGKLSRRSARQAGRRFAMFTFPKDLATSGRRTLPGKTNVMRIDPDISSSINVRLFVGGEEKPLPFSVEKGERFTLVSATHQLKLAYGGYKREFRKATAPPIALWIGQLGKRGAVVRAEAKAIGEMWATSDGMDVNNESDDDTRIIVGRRNAGRDPPSQDPRFRKMFVRLTQIPGLADRKDVTDEMVSSSMIVFKIRNGAWLARMPENAHNTGWDLAFEHIDTSGKILQRVPLQSGEGWNDQWHSVLNLAGTKTQFGRYIFSLGGIKPSVRYALYVKLGQKGDKMRPTIPGIAAR